MPISSISGQGDRDPYAAGRFYESDPDRLARDLETLFNLSQKQVKSPVLAVLSPHAGYAYSGEIAAHSFAQIDPEKNFDNVFIIGSSHTAYIEGASIYSDGNYLTPLGKVEVNIELARQLIDNNSYLSYVPSAHVQEHIIENQLPFLQYHLKQPFRIVPLVIGTGKEKILRSIAATLAPYLNDRNLFVISADFSHYPNHADACKADSITARSITYNDPDVFRKTLDMNLRANYPGLVTSTCGSTAIEMLLYITQGKEDLAYIPLKYMNSGDAPIGDKGRVVGYYSIVLIRQDHRDQRPGIAENDRNDLLRVARMTLEEYINLKEIPILDPGQFSETLRSPAGVFVTLFKDGALRGCTGVLKPEEPLYRLVQEMTIAAATRDRRFQPVRPEELDMLQIEISVLTPLKKISSVDEIRLGTDGIFIVRGDASGTFLPEVALRTGWSLEEFLGHCARDKAGIGWEGWKEAEIYIYQAAAIAESPHPEQ